MVIDRKMEHRAREMAGRMPEDGTPRSIHENEGRDTTSEKDGTVGEPETSTLKAECTASTSGFVLGSPRRDSILVMELRQKVPANDKFDVGAFLRRWLETCTSDMTEVIQGLIGFMDESKPPKGKDDEKRSEECVAPLQKRPREDTYETLEPRIKKLQLKLAEGP